MTAVTDEEVMAAPDAVPTRWSAVAQTLTRPYPVTLPMVTLVMLVPLYLVIARYVPSRTLHVPALGVDGAFALQPAWALVYGSAYMFLIVLPVLLVQQQEQIRRTVYAYLMVWIVAYVCFLLYPTVAPRPAKLIGDGFATWGLRFLYDADPPYNCFPSIHVAHSFVSALTCHRIHRKVGIAAIVCASLVALSTLYTKQHYVADVIGGILLACAANYVFLRGYSAARIPALDNRLAPVVALGTSGVIAVGVAAFWVAYLLTGAA